MTFNRAGAYTFQVTITDSGGLTVASTVNVTVNQTLTSIVVSPSTVTLPDRGKQQFTAQALDQFSQALAIQPAFTWSKLSGRGSISKTGLYTAPSSGTGTAVIQAEAGGKVGPGDHHDRGLRQRAPPVLEVQEVIRRPSAAQPPVRVISRARAGGATSIPAFSEGSVRCYHGGDAEQAPGPGVESTSMPIHDWTRVDAGIFHHFHQRWIGALTDVLNQRLLPSEYYALAEQQGAGFEPDVLTLKSSSLTDRADDEASAVWHAVVRPRWR